MNRNLLLLKLSTQNIIVGAIYRHPSMDLTDINCSYLNKLLENTVFTRKSAYARKSASLELAPPF